MTDSIYTVIITLITTLSGAGIWKYFETRARKKDRDDDFIKNDCKERINKLEALLENAGREKDELRHLILTLTSEVAELRVKVEWLTEENDELLKVRRKQKNQLNG